MNNTLLYVVVGLALILVAIAPSLYRKWQYRRWEKRVRRNISKGMEVHNRSLNELIRELVR